MNKFLIYTRRVMAGAVGLLSLIFLIDITHVLPVELHAVFSIQIVPAIMASSVVILIITGLITLIFGRVYCSVICPLGILQDAILRVKKWYLRIVKKRKTLCLKYNKPLNIIRYGVLALTATAFALGVSYPLMLLDPYSNFGRIATSLFAPLAVWVNNLAAAVLNSMGNYTLYNISSPATAWFVTIFAATILVILIVMVWRRGRLWCNSICPVGTLLGFISRVSLFKISLSAQCNSCGLCSAACKSHCIDTERKTVDTSRCVECFNCLDTCHKNAISYTPRGWKITTGSKDVNTTSSARNDSYVADDSRRKFLKIAAVTAATLPATVLLGKGRGRGQSDRGEYVAVKSRTKFPMPPGAISRELFSAKCTACQLCVSKCPTNVLRPAFMENGWEGMMQPYMDFKVECFCNYECKICSDVCPTHAIFPMSIEEKKLTRVGYAHFRRGRCVVFREDQDCGACAEHCPTQAVHMVAYKDGLTIPKVDPQLCIGCGGCESICPATPKAIFIQGIDVQNQAAKPTDDKLDVEQITDFGF